MYSDVCLWNMRVEYGSMYDHVLCAAGTSVICCSMYVMRLWNPSII